MRALTPVALTLCAGAASAQSLLGGNLQSFPTGNTIESIDPATAMTTTLSSVGVIPRGLAWDAGGGRLYALSYMPIFGPGEVYEVDAASGESTFIAAVAYQNPVGLAFDAERGLLYGTDNSLNVLYTIDPDTGDVAEVGPFVGVGNVEGLAFDSTRNVLYGISDTPKLLVRIDRDTAVATALDVTMPALNLRGLTYSESLDALFITVSTSGSLYRVDDPAGAPVITEIGTISPAGAVQGLAWAEDAPSCYADCNGSGELDFFDFLCFQELFGLGDPEADCDASGGLDFFDFLCFQNEFAAGCP